MWHKKLNSKTKSKKSFQILKIYKGSKTIPIKKSAIKITNWFKKKLIWQWKWDSQENKFISNSGTILQNVISLTTNSYWIQWTMTQ